MSHKKGKSKEKPKIPELDHGTRKSNGLKRRLSHKFKYNPVKSELSSQETDALIIYDIVNSYFSPPITVDNESGQEIDTEERNKQTTKFASLHRGYHYYFGTLVSSPTSAQTNQNHDENLPPVEFKTLPITGSNKPWWKVKFQEKFLQKCKPRKESAEEDILRLFEDPPSPISRPPKVEIRKRGDIPRPHIEGVNKIRRRLSLFSRNI